MISERIQMALRHSTALRTLLYPALAIRRVRLQSREQIANRLLDNLSRLLCEDPIIYVEEFRGRFTTGRNSALLRRLVRGQKYEAELVQICIRHLDQGRDAIDVGANIGLYTVLLAKALPGRRVLSIEPTQGALSKLRTNTQLNDVQESVIVFAGAAWDHRGVVEIKMIPGREEYSSGGLMGHPSIVGANYERVKVSCMTIDDLTRENGLDPGFIKIDVEGMEHVVLDGMRQVLEHNRPVILSELSEPLLRKNGSSSEHVIKFIEGFDYDVIDPLNQNLPAGHRSYGDILCIPNV